MLKFIPFFLLFFFILGACKKDYTCKCTDQFSGSNLTTDHPIKKVTLDKAEEICNKKEVKDLITCSLI